MFKIQQKIVLLSCAIAWAATLVVGAIDYRDDVLQATDRSEEVLTQQARTVSGQVQDSLARLIHDARLISQAAPLALWLRSDRAYPLDEGQGFTAESRRTLARVFRVIMQTRPSFTEIALVGLGEEGREVVRVVRTEDGLQVTPPADLRSRSQEPIHQQARRARPGSWFFPEMGLKVPAAGETDGATTTQSFVMNLEGSSGKSLGYIQIETDAKGLVDRVLRNTNLSNSTFVLGMGGDLLGFKISSEDVEANHFQDPPTHLDLPAAFMFPAETGDRDALMVRDRGQVFATHHGRSDNPGMPEFRVVVSQPVAQMLAMPEAAARSTLLIGGLATFLSGLVAGAFAFWITRPLSQIAHTLRHYEWKGSLDGLPVHLTDEIGDVARSFETLIQRLEESETRAIAIVESMTDALIVIDPRGIILEFSEIAEEMFGYKKWEVQGRNISLLMPEPYRSEHDKYLQRFLEEGEGRAVNRTRELQAMRRNSEIFPIELTVSILGTGEGQAYVGTVRDITERRRTEEMKDSFISAVNHELRTPLTAINAALNLLAQHASDTFDEKSQKLMQLALSGSNRLAQLVNDILDLRRIEAGLLSHHAKRVDIGKLVTDVVYRYGPLAERFQVDFELKTPDDTIHVFVDPGRFEQALVNLLSNAARCSPAGEVVQITVDSHESEWARIDVADRGPGIPESVRERIFERFSRDPQEDQDEMTSNGLGLAIAKSLIEAFNGRISFTTEIGVGTTFHVDLPILSTTGSSREDG